MPHACKAFAFVFLLITCTFSPFNLQAAALRVPSEQEVEDWLRQRTQTHAGLASKILNVQDSYEVVFIPGILASKLRIGNYTFGEDAIQADKLAFAPNQNVTPETLNQFKAHLLFFTSKVDIYGTGLDKLMAALGGKPAFEFAYDWRNDIDILADRLQATLASKFPGKKIILVGHSMGGVIGWHWKNKYPPGTNNVKLVGMVLLGSPLQGSCEPARMLVEGYGPPDGASTFEKAVTKLVFDNAHPAIFTFPSVFQLLPKFENGSACLRMKSGSSELELRHHEPATWLGRSGGSYQAAKQFSAATGLSEQEFTNRVKAAVEAGRRFRQSFKLSQDGIQTFLLYSRAKRIRNSYLIQEKNGWLKVIPSAPNLEGDGRVPVSSAQNSRHFDLSNGAIWKLKREHGELLSDDDFSDFVDAVLKQFMTKLQHVELISYALSDPVLRKEIEGLDWTPDPTVLSKVIQNKDILAAQQSVAEFTVSRLTGAQDNLVKVAKLEGRNIEPDAPVADANQKNRQAATLYKAAMVLDPNNIDARTLNRLGYIFIKQNRNQEAASILTMAKKVASESNDPYLTQDIKQKITANYNYALQNQEAFK